MWAVMSVTCHGDCMIFGLTPVPKLVTGQELSAQDLNNLMQNAQFIEQVAKGPTKLFLAHWRFAPPYFRLLNYDTQAGDIEAATPDTYDDRYFIDQNVQNLDVWEGSFLYRTGMKRLKLAFQTYPLREPKSNSAAEYRYLDGIDLADINKTYYNNKSTFKDGDISLYLILRYTEVPLPILLRANSTKYHPYVRRWSYSRDSAEKQPGTESTPTYKFSAADGNAFSVGSSNSAEYWVPNYPQLHSEGYHTYEIDLESFNFVPGEVVSVKFKLGKPGMVRAWETKGLSYYFSMVYAYVDHELVPSSWQTLNSVSSLSQVTTIAENQAHLVNLLRRYDSPLRAALWDQITANASYASAYSQYNDEWRSYLERFGLDTDVEFLKHSVFAEEARYYFQKQFANKDTLRLAYNVTVNPASAFNMQAIIPYTASSPSSYKIPRKTKRDKADLIPLASNFPEWDQAISLANDYASGSTAYATARNQVAPLTVDLTRVVYTGLLPLESTDLTHLRVKRGFVRFVGPYSAKYGSGAGVTTHFYAGSGLYTGIGNGYGLLTKTAVAPSGFLVGDGVFLSTHKNTTGSEDFGGFYFLRPSVLDAGVPYYSAESTQPVGTSQSLFFGSRILPEAFSYSDIFNFSLTPTSGGKYVPALYAAYVSGLSSSSLGYTAGGYTSLNLQIKESATNLASTTNSVDTLINYSAAYNKASYIGLIRLAEASMFKSDYVVSSFSRLSSFTPLAYSGLLVYLNQLNDMQNQAYALLQQDDSLRYTPLFWTSPKSMYRQYEKLYSGQGRNDNLSFTAIDSELIYFSQTRQADYLVVRGKNVSIGWNGFESIYRDNPRGFFPGELRFTFTDEQSLVGQDIETVVIGFDSLKSLHYGQRYYLKGTVYYAAETMELP
jgi:hypothetical protein